jgi:hypothetical protein
MIEPGVISLGKGNYKLPSTLVAGINPYALVRQALGTHERDKLEKKVWLSLKQVGCLFLNGRLELLGIIPRNSIPRLCFTPVHWVGGKSPIREITHARQ